MTAAALDITAFSDADYVQSFRWATGSTYYDFTGTQLLMMVRKQPDDAEVFISLQSNTVGLEPGASGIHLYQGDDGALSIFDVVIVREAFANMAPGQYVQSMIMLHADGYREDLWRGNFNFAIGPTR